MGDGPAEVAASLIITIDLTDESDFAWVRERVLPKVEEELDEIRESGRLDGDTEISWEQQP